MLLCPCGEGGGCSSTTILHQLGLYSYRPMCVRVCACGLNLRNLTHLSRIDKPVYIVQLLAPFFFLVLEAVFDTGKVYNNNKV